jgi:hypothetical protein
MGVPGDGGTDGLEEVDWRTNFVLPGREMERVRRIEDLLERCLADIPDGFPSKQFIVSAEVLGRSEEDRTVSETRSESECRRDKDGLADIVCWNSLRDGPRDGRSGRLSSCRSRSTCSSLEKCWRRTFSGRERNQ